MQRQTTTTTTKQKQTKKILKKYSKTKMEQRDT